MKKKIAILGSTGSIGKSLIDIIKKDKKNFNIVLLTAEKNYSELLKQAKLFKEQLKGIIHHYLLLARKEERATIMQALRSSGHKEMAEYIRRL